jgi:photosystem II stability/assembly factor-like uncharacterized protein
MKNKILLLLPIILLAAGCNFFSPAVLVGVVKTVNGGVDWQFSNGGKSSKVNLSSLNISKLALSPANHEVVYAASYNSGLYKSEDSGATWSGILSKIMVYDFAVDAVSPKVIYAAGKFGNLGKVLKTQDGGSSWQEIYNEATANNPIRALVLNPANSNQIVIGSGSGNIIRSADGGLSWQLAQNFNERVQGLAWQQSGLYVLLRNKGLFKSSNFGANFENLSTGITGFKAKDLQASSNSDKIFNQFYVDNLTSGLIYISSDKGLYKSVDAGKTWARLALPVKTSDAEVVAIQVGSGSSNLVFTSVGATIYKSTDAGNSWQIQSIGTSGYINYLLVDFKLPQIVYAGLYASQ